MNERSRVEKERRARGVTTESSFNEDKLCDAYVRVRAGLCTERRTFFFFLGSQMQLDVATSRAAPNFPREDFLFFCQRGQRHSSTRARAGASRREDDVQSAETGAPLAHDGRGDLVLSLIHI